MDTSRLKRALNEELYWVFHGFIGLIAALALVLQTPLTLGPSLACGLAVFVLLFAAHLWRPTAIAALVLTGVLFTVELAGLGAGFAMNIGFEPGSAVMALAGAAGAGLGGWFAVWQGRRIFTGLADEA